VSAAEIRDVAPGLWLWRAEHWEWRPGLDWEPVVTSVWVESGGVRFVLDPLAPPAEAAEVWQRLDASPPDVAVVLKPDHLRDLDQFVQRYGCRALGPDRELLRGAVPEEHLPAASIEPVRPGDRLPGGIVAHDDGRGRHEAPLWLPEQRTVVFADALTERGGDLRVWTTPRLEDRALPALRALLDLPFEHVIISHGEPVHARAEYERALERPPWPASPLHVAALLGDLELVRHLVEQGADITARDELHGATPLAWAQRGGHRAVVDYLEARPT
jgi:hypothetical protein